MKLKPIIIPLLLTVFFLVGCSKKLIPPPPSVEVTRIEKEIIRDTILTTKVDSTLYSALIECQNGKPVLKAVDPPIIETVLKPNTAYTTIKANKAQLLKSPRKPPDIQLKGNILEITCYTQAQQLFFSWKEKYLQENRLEIQKEYIPYPLKWWQKTLMWLGGLFLLTTVGGIALKFIKPKIL